MLNHQRISVRWFSRQLEEMLSELPRPSEKLKEERSTALFENEVLVIIEQVVINEHYDQSFVNGPFSRVKHFQKVISGHS